MMKITRKSQLTGKWNTMDIPITDEQLWMWENGDSIQHVLPDATPEQREFLINGATEEEWNKTFPDGDN